MNVIEVHEVWIRFILRHQKFHTLLGSTINFFSRKENHYNNDEEENFWALKNISFSAKGGDSLGIIGKNGAGKSTLLQLLGGIYKPDRGSIITKGSVGLLQLRAGFHPELTGKDNIYLSGATLGLQKEQIDNIYESIVDFSELWHFIDTPIKNYSSGMTSRLGFAIAINIEPDILLIDEVLSVGDMSFKKKSKKKLNEIRDKGKTIVFVSHALSEVKKLCNRGICLNEGEMIFEGNSKEAVNFYQKNFSK